MPDIRVKRTIWVIDDSPTDSGRVAITLQDDYTVKIFHDGAAALEQLSTSELPDLLLLDWVMPGMSGVEICTYVRSANPPISQLPIILLTAQHGATEITQAFKNGANDYIVKPFVEEELKARVRVLINSKLQQEHTDTLLRNLQRTEERLSIATNAAGVGIWEWDIRLGNVTSTEIHRDIFELPISDKNTFNDIFERILPEDRQAVKHSLSLSIENKLDYSSEFRIQKLDGTIAWIRGHGRVVYSKNENPIRMVGTHVDVSLQKKTEQDLQAAKDSAERATQMKSAFLANMSHEIRTPLGAMLGFAHLMQDPTIHAMDLAQYLEVLVRNGEQLSTIINDILDLSKVEAGLLTYEYHKFNPAEICGDIVDLFKAKAKEKGLAIECHKDDSTPAFVVTDPTRLRQILTNLVGNALKFTRSGSIKIKSSARVADNQTKYLVVDVIDTGIGVPPEQVNRIFDMFVQGDETTTRRFGGTGIGLALSRQLARELGGDLELSSSSEGIGSTFRVLIKDQQGKPRESEIKSEISKAATATSLVGIRVLVVDDSPDNQTLLSLYLSKRGASVEVANNGLDGYQKALRNSYDIVLMDLQMPQMDGYAATKKLREVGYKKPIIALTAHAMSEISAQCIEAGCSGYLPKPINPTELVATIVAHTQ